MTRECGRGRNRWGTRAVALALVVAGAFGCSKEDSSSKALDLTPEMVDLRDSIKKGESEIERMKAELALATPEKQAEIKKKIQALRTEMKEKKGKLREAKGLPAEKPSKKGTSPEAPAATSDAEGDDGK